MTQRFSKARASLATCILFLLVLLCSRYRSLIYDANTDKPTEIHSLRSKLSKFMDFKGVVTLALFDKAYIPWAIDFHRNMKHHGIHNLLMVSLDGESQAC